MDTSAAGRAQGATPAPLNRSSTSDATLVAPTQAVRQPPRGGRARSENRDGAKARPHPATDDDGRPAIEVDVGHSDHDPGDRPLAYSASGSLTSPDTPSDKPEGPQNTADASETPASVVLQAVDPATGQVYWQAAFDQEAAAALSASETDGDDRTLNGLLGTRAYRGSDERDDDDRPKVIRTA